MSQCLLSKFLLTMFIISKDINNLHTDTLLMASTVEYGRFLESQFPDLQMRLENLENQNWHIRYEVEQIKRTNSVIKELRVVDLVFDPTKVGKSVEEVNRYLERGFEVFKQFQTESGLVIELARWGTNDE